jgi:hypothetical protein
MSRSARWLVVGGVTAGVAVVFLAFLGPLLFAGAYEPPPPPPAIACPSDPARLAGQRFTATKDLPGDLRCADLRGAVLDGLDLTAYTFDRADLRGASLRHVDLAQVDLIGTNLAGADLSFADLSQADLTGADLRGANLWMAGSVEATTDDALIRPVQDGVLQVGYVLVAGAVLVLLAGLVRMARGIPGEGASRRRGRPGAQRTLGLIGGAAGITVVLFLFGKMLAALWTVQLLVPLAVTAGVLLVAALVEQLAPTTSEPAPAPPVVP